jgi:hypothetical protein
MQIRFLHLHQHYYRVQHWAGLVLKQLMLALLRLNCLL